MNFSSLIDDTRTDCLKDRRHSSTVFSLEVPFTAFQVHGFNTNRPKCHKTKRCQKLDKEKNINWTTVLSVY